jgi:hypothetical protein
MAQGLGTLLAIIHCGQFGADVTLEIWEGLHHVFQQHTEEFVSSRKALDASAEFLLRLFDNHHN